MGEAAPLPCLLPTAPTPSPIAAFDEPSPTPDAASVPPPSRPSLYRLRLHRACLPFRLSRARVHQVSSEQHSRCQSPLYLSPHPLPFRLDAGVAASVYASISAAVLGVAASTAGVGIEMGDLASTCGSGNVCWSRPPAREVEGNPLGGIGRADRGLKGAGGPSSVGSAQSGAAQNVAPTATCQADFGEPSDPRYNAAITSCSQDVGLSPGVVSLDEEALGEGGAASQNESFSGSFSSTWANKVLDGLPLRTVDHGNHNVRSRDAFGDSKDPPSETVRESDAVWPTLSSSSSPGSLARTALCAGGIAMERSGVKSQKFAGVRSSNTIDFYPIHLDVVMRRDSTMQAGLDNNKINTDEAIYKQFFFWV